MPREAAHDTWWRTFEVVFGVPTAIAIVLHFVALWSLSSGTLAPPLVVIGSALVIAGVAIFDRARRALRRHGQPTEPGRATRMIVTSVNLRETFGEAYVSYTQPGSRSW